MPSDFLSLNSEVLQNRELVSIPSALRKFLLSERFGFSYSGQSADTNVPESKHLHLWNTSSSTISDTVKTVIGRVCSAPNYRIWAKKKKCFGDPVFELLNSQGTFSVPPVFSSKWWRQSSGRWGQVAACSDAVEGGRENQVPWRELSDGWIMGNLKAFGALWIEA